MLARSRWELPVYERVNGGDIERDCEAAHTMDEVRWSDSVSRDSESGIAGRGTPGGTHSCSLHAAGSVTSMTVPFAVNQPHRPAHGARQGLRQSMPKPDESRVREESAGTKRSEHAVARRRDAGPVIGHTDQIIDEAHSRNPSLRGTAGEEATASSLLRRTETSRRACPRAWTRALARRFAISDAGRTLVAEDWASTASPELPRMVGGFNHARRTGRPVSTDIRRDHTRSVQPSSRASVSISSTRAAMRASPRRCAERRGVREARRCHGARAARILEPMRAGVRTMRGVGDESDGASLAAGAASPILNGVDHRVEARDVRDLRRGRFPRRPASFSDSLARSRLA